MAFNINIRIDTAEQDRVFDAFGKRLGLEDDLNLGQTRRAVAAEVTADVIKFIQESVANIERNDAAQAARDAVLEINPV